MTHYRTRIANSVEIHTASPAARFLALAALIFWGPAAVLLAEAPAVVADDSALVTKAVLELERPVIDVVVPVAVRTLALESAVIIALAEPFIEP